MVHSRPMPDIRIPTPIKEAINKQPERNHPFFLSFQRTTEIILEEALKVRGTKIKKCQKPLSEK